MISQKSDQNLGDFLGQFLSEHMILKITILSAASINSDSASFRPRSACSRPSRSSSISAFKRDLQTQWKILQGCRIRDTLILTPYKMEENVNPGLKEICSSLTNNLIFIQVFKLSFLVIILNLEIFNELEKFLLIAPKSNQRW